MESKKKQLTSKDFVFVKMLAYATLGGLTFFVIKGQNIFIATGLM